MKKIVFIFLYFVFCSLNIFSQGIWTQKSDFGGTGRIGAIGFSIGTKGYIGTGNNCTSGICVTKDFWEWDQTTNVWTQKADFGGTARYDAVSFSIGMKGYIGTGYSWPNVDQDFWEWDQATNIWTQKTDFPGGKRHYAVGFSIGLKGYIGTGSDDLSNLHNDFWEWNGDTTSSTYNTWTQKANFGGTSRMLAVGFSIGRNGYIGTGSTGNQPGFNDFWQYDTTADTWTQKANFSGTQRFQAVGFSINDKGYIGAGWNGAASFNDFWEYDTTADKWTQKANYGGNYKYGAVGFSIGNKGYIGTGDDGYYDADFWEYDPSINGINEINFSNLISVYPNPFSETATIQIANSNITNCEIKLYDVLGNIIKKETIRNSASFVIAGDNLPNGIYFLNLQTSTGRGIKKLVIQK